jgi:hypothetical protein
MSHYQKVRWTHDFADEPVLLFSELDESDLETRKVEIFDDGRSQYANSSNSSGDTRLGERAIPSIDEIRAQPEFAVWEIEPEEFENVWRRAIGKH